MAKGMEVKCTVSFDEKIHKLQELCNEIKQLSDLVPEWSRLEVEEHEEKIKDILFELIETNTN